MYLDYSKLEFDKNGMPEVPELELRTLGNQTIGVIPGVFNLKLNIKFSEPSEISFDIPATIDGAENPLYDAVSGHKQIYTKCYGVYEILNPSTEADGISEVKHVSGYSYEKTLEAKKFFIEEGTFNFWNPVTPADTVLGRVLEIAVGWTIGYVSPSLIGRYRTFDGYDDYLLSFLYNSAPEKFRCVFVFDTYKKTINAYDADEERPSLPIYLDFGNLLQSMDIEELSDELVTAIRPYGADELDIRDVNPIGSNWIYDLSYFIANGDIPKPLASKWLAWQQSVINSRAYYQGLSALRASATARLLAEQAALKDLQGELETLVSQQSVTIQAQAMETTVAGKDYQQRLLSEINTKISAKEQEIKQQNALISSIKESLDIKNSSSYTAQIKAVTDRLSISNYFTDSEYQELSHFFIEEDLTEDTFVATDVNDTVSGNTYSITNTTISVSGSFVSEVDLTAQFKKKMYMMSGGTFTCAGNQRITGDIIRGTLESSSEGNFVLSFYTGTIRVNDKTASSGMITVSGSMSAFSSNISSVTVDEVITYEGSALQFTARSASLFMTANVSDYQQYSVEMELYDYAVNVLSDLATPTYEFSVDSGNFLFAQEFAPFRNQLELGKGVYLNVGGNQTITPYIIEFELDFEDRSHFSIIFSNRFKRHDAVNTLKDMIESSYSSSRSFDAGKYIYNKTVGQASQVSKFMSDSLNAAKNTILAAKNQSVVIDGAGIHIGGDSKYQIRIVNSMIALSDDDWETCKLAIGHFASPEIGEYFGVNAEVIGGNLIVGNNLVIDTGNGHFKVDQSGVYIDSMKFYILNSANKTLHDEFSEISSEMSGLSNNINGLDTKLSNKISEFYSSGYLNAGKLSGVIAAQQAKMQSAGGNVLFDSDGIWLLNGTSKAQSTKAIWMNNEGILFGSGSKSSNPGASNSGWSWTTAIGHDGITATALAGKTVSGMKLYGGELHIGPKPGGGYYFNVDSSGNMTAETGTFKGTVQASRYLDTSGSNMMNGGKFLSDYLDLRGITIRDNANNISFQVSSNGSVTIGGTVSGTINMGPNSTINWSNISNTNLSSNPAYNLASTASSKAGAAKSRADEAYTKAGNAEEAASAVDLALSSLKRGIGYTYLDGQYVISPNIVGATIKGGKFYNLSGNAYMEIGGSDQADMTLWGSGRNRVFQIMDGVGGISISSYGYDILSASLGTTCPEGVWDFRNATVRGLNTTATFG